MSNVLSVDTANGEIFSLPTQGGPLIEATAVPGASSPGTATSLVYRPAGPVDASNVFTTWAEVMTARALIQGPFSIQFDGALCSVPAGGPYDLNGCTLLAAHASDTLEFEDGATATASLLNMVGGIVQCVSAVTSPFTIAGGLLFAGNFQTFIQATGAAPFFHVAAGGFFFPTFENANLGDGAHPVITVSAGSAQPRFLVCFVAANALGAGAVAHYQFDDATAVIPPVGAGWVATPVSDSSRTLYTPAVLADWSGTAPTSVKNALDRIAAKITPIP